MVRTALAAANLYGWIFIFQFFYAHSMSLNSALVATLLLYSVVQDVTLLMTPLAARALNNGAMRLMVKALMLAAASYVLLGLAFLGALGQFVVVSLMLFAVLRGVYRALYWVPYSVESPSVHGSSAVRKWPEILVAFVPAVAGLILTSGLTGVIIVLFGSALLLLLSTVPLVRLEDRRETFSWSYLQTFKQLVSRRHRTLALTAFFDGMAGVSMLLLWPIAVFLIIGWSYAMLGIVMTATYLVVMASKHAIRQWMRRVRIDESPLVHAALVASSWILRLTVSTPVGVVLVDTYFYTGTPIRGAGIDRLVFDQVADKGSYIDEYTTLKEMAMAAGKIIMCLIAALLATYASLAGTLIFVFILAALASGASVYLTRTADI